MIKIVQIEPSSFSAHEELLKLLQHAFAYMEGRINPPSSLGRLNIQSLKQKILDETLFTAVDGQRLVGCAFAKINDDTVYLGKLAVHADYQGLGLSRQLITRVEQLALQSQLPVVEMETRIELTENQQLFEHLGYRRVAENSHAGFSRPTSYCYQKNLA